MREMIWFGIPVSALFASNFALGAVDTIATSRFGGLRDLAALAPGNAAMEYTCYVLSAIATVTLNQLAPTRPGSAEWHRRLSVAGVFTLLAALVQAAVTFLCADTLAHLVGCPPAVADRAASYLRLRAPGVVPFHLAAACSSSFFAAKDSVTPFLGTLIAVAVNVVGDLALCPRYGLVGAAAATSFSQGCLLLFLFLRMKARGLLPPGRVHRNVRWSDVRALGRLVAPVSLLTAMRTSLYAVLSFWCCQLGIVSAAAQQIAATVFWGSTAAAAEPMSAAAQTYVPIRYEAWRATQAQVRAAAGTEAESEASLALADARSALGTTVRRLVRTAALFGGGVLALVHGLMQPWALGLITTSAATVAQVPRLPLLTIAAVAPFALLCEGVLLGFSARAALVRNLGACVAVSLGGACALVHSGRHSVGVLWWFVAVFQSLRMVSNALVLRNKMQA